MSVRVMTAVWDIDLSDSEKIVLLALADCANDEGWCWPSMATLARKCSKTDRTVQHAIRDLCAAGHLTRIESPGKGCRYQVHPRNDFTPEATSPPKPFPQPPKRLRGTPETASDKPSKNHKEPSGRGAHARRATPAIKNDQGDKNGTRLPDGWTPPTIDQLQPTARKLVQQWPSGAYEAACETFRLHWLAATGAKAFSRDWDAALAKWLISDHAKIMRDAKAGVSFAMLAPTKDCGPALAAVQAVSSKMREDGASGLVHAALREELGASLYDTWLANVALIHDAPGVIVIAGSEFARSWIEDRFQSKIMAAARAVLGSGVRWVRFHVEQSSKGEPNND